MPDVWTVGHSNRPLEILLEMLKAHGIELLADVRTVPRSRYNPQFNRDTFPEALAAEAIGYIHMPGLGGLRHAKADSQNTAWRNPSFRGYADYMQTAEFQQHLEELIGQAESRRTAVMCAESLPWRCHRSLIADALTARNITVRHIMTPEKADPHRLTSFACVEGNRVSYPPAEPGLFD